MSNNEQYDRATNVEGDKERTTYRRKHYEILPGELAELYCRAADKLGDIAVRSFSLRTDEGWNAFRFDPDPRVHACKIMDLENQGYVGVQISSSGDTAELHERVKKLTEQEDE